MSILSNITINIKQLKNEDIPSVIQVQKNVYISELLESGETFAKKIRLFSQGCLGCWNEQELLAYVISHPWHKDEIVPLNSDLNELPANTRCLYIHDLAVLKKFQSNGIANRLLDTLFLLTDSLGYTEFTLVAVQNSESFWEKYGFIVRSKLIYGVTTPASKMTLTRIPVK